MKVHLRVVQERKGTPIAWYSRAATVTGLDRADVYVLVWDSTDKKLVGHELTHVLEGEHHPWHHFCLRVWHRFRVWRHNGEVSRDLVDEFLRDGILELALA